MYMLMDTVHRKGNIKYLFFLAILFIPFLGISANIDDEVAQLEKQCAELEKEGNRLELARCQTKLAFLYRDNNKFPKATDYFIRAIKNNEALGNANAIKNLSVNLGLLYSEHENYDQAIAYFNKSLKINEKQNKQSDILSDLINIALAYQGMKKPGESNQALEKAISIAQELGDMAALKNCYGMMSENYDRLGKPDKSKEYFELAASLKSYIQKEEIKKFESRTKSAEAESVAKDAVLKSKNQEIEKMTKEQQLTLELLEKQKEISILKEHELKTQENLHKARQRNINLIFAAVAFILILIIFFLIILFKQLKEKKKANKLLEENNKQILEQKLEIEKQRDIAKIQTKRITDSIQYAQRIQNAVLPPLHVLESLIPEHFVLFRPRDIVSGDFYWLSGKDGILIVAAVDCTGHGVPGAFMSMLGIAFLNDIVNKITFNRHILALHANEILNQLRENVINSLHQTGKPNESKDGMDIALCVIDFEHKQMQYAGAHNPVYIIRNGEFLITDGDKMPIGIYKNSHLSFTNHELPLEIGDQIYIFSDGYYDQFGGPNNMKLMSANFRKYLLEIHEKPMKEQKELLENYYDNWKNGKDQVDDVLVIGFRFEPQIIPTTLNREYQWDSIQILIAEDVDLNYFLLVEALKSTKAQIVRVVNGKDAVEYIQKNKADLVLMDIRMPIMDGIEATKEIRKFNKQIPIIAQTALGEEGDVELIEKAGCNDYIAKPINLKSFLSVIKKNLKNN